MGLKKSVGTTDHYQLEQLISLGQGRPIRLHLQIHQSWDFGQLVQLISYCVAAAASSV